MSTFSVVVVAVALCCLLPLFAGKQLFVRTLSLDQPPPQKDTDTDKQRVVDYSNGQQQTFYYSQQRRYDVVGGAAFVRYRSRRRCAWSREKKSRFRLLAFAQRQRYSTFLLFPHT